MGSVDLSGTAMLTRRLVQTALSMFCGHEGIGPFSKGDCWAERSVEEELKVWWNQPGISSPSPGRAEELDGWLNESHRELKL